MRRVAVSGIRLEVESSHGASDRDAPAVPPVRVRVASRRGNFLSLTSADATTLAAARHPLATGDGVLDQTVEFIAAPSVAAALLASLEYVNVDMGILGGANAGADAGAVAESAANGRGSPLRRARRRRPHATTRSSSRSSPPRRRRVRGRRCVFVSRCAAARRS